MSKPQVDFGNKAPGLKFIDPPASKGSRKGANLTDVYIYLGLHKEIVILRSIQD
jgi:hypothetical protein